jgi:hypothetical protein
MAQGFSLMRPPTGACKQTPPQIGFVAGVADPGPSGRISVFGGVKFADVRVKLIPAAIAPEGVEA